MHDLCTTQLVNKYLPFQLPCYNHKTTVFYVIHAGRKGNKAISEFRCYAGIIKRHLFYIRVKILKFCLSISLEKFVEFKYIVSLFKYLRAKYGNYFIISFTFFSVKNNLLMFFIIVRIFVIGQIAEHSTGFHVMTVIDQVGSKRINTTVCIKDQAAIAVFVAVIILV